MCLHCRWSPHPALQRLLSDPPAEFPGLARIHCLVVTSGHSYKPFLVAKLISLYSAFGRPDLATEVFRTSIPHQSEDTFLWNSIIKTHFSHGDFPLALRLYSRMRARGLKPNHFTMPMVASASAELLDLMTGSCVHGDSIKFGLLGRGSVGVGSSLVYMYSKCLAVGEALNRFSEMPEKDVVSWTAIIIGCVRNNKCELALGYLRDMHKSGEKPNSRTIEGGLQACVSMEALLEGRTLHAFALKSGLGCCDFVKSSILSLYSKCDNLEDATIIFDELHVKDLFSWTEMLGNFTRKGFLVESVELFRMMLDSRVYPDGISIRCLLTMCATFGSTHGGRAFHAIILRRNFTFDVLVRNSLVGMYFKLGMLRMARILFDTMDKRDENLWSLMLIGYEKVGLSAECLTLFRKLQHFYQGSVCKSEIVVAAVSSCSQLGELNLGESIHCYAIKNKLELETSVLNSLVGMYGRCMKLNYSKRIFDRMKRDVITWNTMMAVYSQVGYSDNALSIFSKMLSENVKPSKTTLIVALSACSNAVSLNWGEWIHNYIKENVLECEVPLSTALIDMYGKCGQLALARNIFDSMNHRDIVTWNVIISAYGNHGCAEEALQMFKEMEDMGVAPNGITFLAALSACSHACFVEAGKFLFKKMDDHFINPTCKHYACMVDLLGRSGYLKEAEDMILTMPIVPDGGVWGALLSACKIHNNLKIGEHAGKMALELDPYNDGYHILLSNMYSCAGRREDAERLRESMIIKGVKKRVGWSMVELDGKSYIFVVEDKSHPLFEEMHCLLEVFLRHMEECVGITP